MRERVADAFCTSCVNTHINAPRSALTIAVQNLLRQLNLRGLHAIPRPTHRASSQRSASTRTGEHAHLCHFARPAVVSSRLLHTRLVSRGIPSLNTAAFSSSNSACAYAARRAASAAASAFFVRRGARALPFFVDRDPVTGVLAGSLSESDSYGLRTDARARRGVEGPAPVPEPLELEGAGRGRRRGLRAERGSSLHQVHGQAFRFNKARREWRVLTASRSPRRLRTDRPRRCR